MSSANVFGGSGSVKPRKRSSARIDALSAVHSAPRPASARKSRRGIADCGLWIVDCGLSSLENGIALTCADLESPTSNLQPPTSNLQPSTSNLYFLSYA